MKKYLAKITTIEADNLEEVEVLDIEPRIPLDVKLELKFLEEC